MNPNNTKITKHVYNKYGKINGFDKNINPTIILRNMLKNAILVKEDIIENDGRLLIKRKFVFNNRHVLIVRGNTMVTYYYTNKLKDKIK